MTHRHFPAELKAFYVLPSYFYFYVLAVVVTCGFFFGSCGEVTTWSMFGSVYICSDMTPQNFASSLCLWLPVYKRTFCVCPVCICVNGWRRQQTLHAWPHGEFSIAIKPHANKHPHGRSVVSSRTAQKLTCTVFGADKVVLIVNCIGLFFVNLL